MRRALVIYDFATDPFWNSSYMRKIWLFYQRINRSQTYEWNWDWGRAVSLLWNIFSNFRYSVFAVQGESQKGRVTRIRKGKMTKMPTTLWRSHTGEKVERRLDCIPVQRCMKKISAVEEKPFTSSPEALCTVEGAELRPPPSRLTGGYLI